jgi:hypothetical protein
MEAAKRMGGKVTEAEASAITEEASITRKHLSADNLARFLGVTYAQRQALGLTTIGSINVKRGARKELRKLRARRALAAKRHANGVRPRSEYEANSTAAQARAQGVSRMTIYRRKRAEQGKNKPHVTGVSTASFLSSEDRPVTPAGVEGLAERGFASKKAEDFRLRRRRPRWLPTDDDYSHRDQQRMGCGSRARPSRARRRLPHRLRGVALD